MVFAYIFYKTIDLLVSIDHSPKLMSNFLFFKHKVCELIHELILLLLLELVKYV